MPQIRLGIFQSRWYSVKSSLSNNDATKDALNSILDHFKSPIPFCFGYGSGVYSQGLGQKNANTQIDFIFGVENSEEWHRSNVQQNPGHYSWLRYLGPKFLTSVQRNFGAGVYFNPYCEINGHKVKYGVVELEDLKRDLENWENLYLAGRLQKPVRILRKNESVAKSQEENLLAAISVALLLLPEEFSEQDLYLKIAGMSYMGDVRMALAENPNKVKNIVKNQFQLFRKLYTPLLERHPFPVQLQDSIPDSGVGPDAKGVPMKQFIHEREFLLESLPPRFLRKLGGESKVDDPKIRTKVATAVLTTVKKPSFTQSAKGLFTAGLGRSLLYSFEKLKKRFT